MTKNGIKYFKRKKRKANQRNEMIARIKKQDYSTMINKESGEESTS